MFMQDKTNDFYFFTSFVFVDHLFFIVFFKRDSLII